MHLTKCLCTYISVSDCTNLKQAACYWTHKTIAHETFHTTQINHTYCTKIHTYKHTYLFFIFIKTIKKWGKGNITEAARVLFYMSV